MMSEEMRFDSRQTQGEPVLAKGRHRLRVRQQCRAGAFIDAPGTRRRHVDSRVGIEQATVVGAQDVASFGLGQKFSEGAPCLRKNLPDTVEKPLYLLAAA